MADRDVLGGVLRGLSERVERRSHTRARKDDEHMRLLVGFGLAADANCIDVGAHQGAFLRECVRVAPAGRHIAYEPIPELAEGLGRDFSGVDVRRAALGAEAGEHQFFHVRSLPSHSGLRERDYPGPQEVEPITVAVERLDDALPEGYVPALIKIDVEGGERDVVAGGLETIRTHRPTIVFEHGRGAAEHYDAGPGELHSLLCEQAGLRIFDLDANGPYDRAAFERMFENGPYFNFVAHP
jgi:FkbM family methyltransferase